MNVTLEDLGEIRIAERIRERLDAVPGVGDRGPGDDAAVVRVPGDRIVLTVDTQREGVHFRRDWLSAGQIGRRALAVAVSDLAAMGARPLCALCAVVLPTETSLDWFDGLIEGLAAAGKEFGCPVVGGDVSQPAHGVSLCVTAVGTLGPDERAPGRAGALPGDACIVVGPLGRAATGRELLAAGRAPGTPAEELCVAAYREPRPLVAAGRALAPLCHAMMDVSDGLTMDLARICSASKVGAELDPGTLVDAPLAAAAASAGGDPLARALRGGDDYALLLAVSPDGVDRVLEAADGQGAGARVIGRFGEGPGLRLVTVAGGADIEPGGWDPFAGGTT